jgi:hypothetical protein
LLDRFPLNGRRIYLQDSEGNQSEFFRKPRLLSVIVRIGNGQNCNLHTIINRTVEGIRVTSIYTYHQNRSMPRIDDSISYSTDVL